MSVKPIKQIKQIVQILTHPFQLALKLIYFLRFLDRNLEIDRRGNIKIQGYNYVLTINECGINVVSEQIVRVNGRLILLNTEPNFQTPTEQKDVSRPINNAKS